MKQYLFNLFLAIDQLCNAILNGHPDETLSSRSYRAHRDGKPMGFMRRVIDVLFFFQPDHCHEAYNSEKTARHLPPEFRD